MIWILWHKRVGDLNQMVALAKALDLPYQIKKLQFRKPHYAPLSRLLLQNASELNAPYPKLVLSAEAMCSNIAHHVKKNSGGTVKTVALARPCGDPAKFDLVLTTAQYGLNGTNVVTLNLPLTVEPKPAPTRREASTMLLLVGGTAPPDILDGSTAEKICMDLKLHKNLCVLTSPRTPDHVAQIFARHFSNTHIWQKGKANPYAEKLATAAHIIVTSDSASMLADALVQQVPVEVYKLPQRLNILQRLVLQLHRTWPKCFIFNLGHIEPTPNRLALVDHLVKQGFVSWFGVKSETATFFDPKLDVQAAKTVIMSIL
jgi:mitochondrial fission protein ELM1